MNLEDRSVYLWIGVALIAIGGLLLGIEIGIRAGSGLLGGLLGLVLGLAIGIFGARWSLGR